MVDAPQMECAAAQVCNSLLSKYLKSFSLLESCQMDETCSISSNQDADNLNEQRRAMTS
jgi:hypothetical protein